MVNHLSSLSAGSFKIYATSDAGSFSN
ncbi:hypothetical protein CP8484711_0521A, partial [Chlamydia psittaci 84-8471/1]